jgi:hypothetical protein
MLVLFLYHITFAPHTLHLLISSHIHAYVIDHTEPELEELPEQAQTKDTTPILSKASPGASNPILEVCLTL